MYGALYLIEVCESGRQANRLQALQQNCVHGSNTLNSF